MLKFTAVFLITSFLSLIAFANDKPSVHCQDSLKIIEEGDVVYISNHNYLFRQVEKDTMTWASHVGIAFKDPKNKDWMVYESTWPKSKLTPICDFLARSFEEKLEIKRLNRKLIPAEIRVMKMAATNMFGLSYDQGFDYVDAKTSFCSKYVFKTFQTININVGVLETFQSLLDKNPSMDLTFWKAWFFGSIPYERLTITPASQILDSQFTTVYAFNNKM